MVVRHGTNAYTAGGDRTRYREPVFQIGAGSIPIIASQSLYGISGYRHEGTNQKSVQNPSGYRLRFL